MDDFFERIKQGLESREAPVFVKDDWDKLERQLFEHESKRSAIALKKWLLLGASAFAGVFLIIISLLYQKNQQLDLLQQQLEQYQSRDTIYIRQLVTVYDTVYTTKGFSPSESMARISFPAGRQGPFSTISLFKGRFDPQMDHYSPFSWPVERLLPRTESLSRTASLSETATHLESTDSMLTEVDIEQDVPLIWPIAGRAIRPSRREEVNARLGLDPQVQENIKPKSIVNFLRPQAYYLSLSGGLGIPISSDIHASVGTTFDLDLHVAFSKQLGLWGGLRYIYSHFEVDDPLGVSLLPIVEPPAPGYSLTNAEIAKTSLAYSLGVRYSIPLPQKWRLQLDLAYTNLWQFSFEANYEYRNELDNNEWLLPIDVDQQEHISNILTGRVGATYPFSKSMHGSLLMSYLRNLTPGGLNRMDQISFETGLLYHF